MIGASGQVEYSTNNGETWTSIPKFATGTLTGLAYGNGIFVAVEYESKSIWSTDIPTNEWKNIYTFSDNPLEGCRYVNNEFVVVGENGLIAKSNDAKNWITVYREANMTFYDIAYGNGKYVVSGKTGRVMSSVNGMIWYPTQIVGVEKDIRHIVYANGTFVIGAGGGLIEWSEDGINWNQANNPSANTISWIRGFAYGDNRLYTCMYGSSCGEIWLSEDKGKTWSVVLTQNQRLWTICYGNDTFIVGGESGLIYKLDLEIQWLNERPNAEVVYYKEIVIQNDGSSTFSDVYQDIVPSITREKVINIVGEATTTLSGVMSATDKANLDRLVASAISVLSGTAEPTSDVGEDGDIYLVTEE